MKKNTTGGLLLIIIILAAIFYWSTSGAPDSGTLACSNGKLLYEVKNTPLQFCYFEQWGEPAVKNVETKAGKYFTLEFANTDGLIMKFQSFDFAPADSNTTAFNFNELRMTADDESLKQQLMEQLKLKENELKVIKSDISGTRAIRAHLTFTDSNGKKIDTINYYVPNAIPDYSIIISANNSMAVAVDELVYDMQL
jgi:hypothetical protein